MKNNISIMYINHNNTCRFINYELLSKSDKQKMDPLEGSDPLSHVTTTDEVHSEKLINQNAFFYKYLLLHTRGKNFQSRQISLIWGGGRGGI